MLGLRIALLIAVERSQVMQAHNNLGMIRLQGFFPNIQCTEKKRRCQLEVSLRVVNLGQIAQAGCYIEIAPAPALFPQQQRFFQKRFVFSAFLSRIMHHHWIVPCGD